MVILSMLTRSRVTSSLKGFYPQISYVNRSFIVQGNLGAQARVRGIYTHTRDTGIKIFDENMKQLKSSGQWLPSYIHNSPDISQEEMEEVYAAFPEIVKDFATWPATPKFIRANQKTRELLEHAVAWSPNAAAMTMMADRFYARQRRLENKIVSEQDEKARLRRAHQLAWCLELIIRPLYMMDDIMDGHEKRNGLPTWNSLSHIGLRAVNDVALMTQGGYILLHKYFGSQDYYSDLLSKVYDSCMTTQAGENEQKLIDMLFLEQITHESFSCAKGVWNAAVYPNICIIGAMIINGIRDLELERQVSQAGVDCMIYGTIVDDYLDCYGGELINERQSSDISEGKQTWLLYKAMELASPEQRRRIKMNYGKGDVASVKAVLQIYKELNIKETILNLAEETYETVREKINELPQKKIPVNMLYGLIDHYSLAAQGVLPRI